MQTIIRLCQNREGGALFRYKNAVVGYVTFDLCIVCMRKNKNKEESIESR